MEIKAQLGEITDVLNKINRSLSASLIFKIFVDNETPAGAINGVNTTFTLANAPDPSGSLQLFLNGMLLTVGEDYTIIGLTITLLSAPLTGSIFRAFYRH